jgi:hypothetical protein
MWASLVRMYPLNSFSYFQTPMNESVISITSVSDESDCIISSESLGSSMITSSASSEMFRYDVVSLKKDNSTFKNGPIKIMQ